VIRLHDERARALRVVAAAGPGAEALIGQLCPTRRGRASLTIGVLSFVSKRPILINRARPLLPSEAYWPEVRSALVSPIRAQERPMGVLRLEATRRFTFDDEDVKVFSILGEQIGHVIERARALEDAAPQAGRPDRPVGQPGEDARGRPQAHRAGSCTMSWRSR